MFTKDILGLQTFREVADSLGSGQISEVLGVGDRANGRPQNSRASCGSLGQSNELEFMNSVVLLAQLMVGLCWVSQLCPNTMGQVPCNFVTRNSTQQVYKQGKLIGKDTTQLTRQLIVLSIIVSRKGSIFWSNKQCLDTKMESTKQLDNPESTRALTDARKERDESMNYNAFKIVSDAKLRYSTDSLTGLRQSTSQSTR